MADEAARPGGTVTTPLPPGPAGPPAVETSPTESSPSVYQGLMRPVGGPVSAAWREGTLTRAKELEFLCEWVVATHPKPHSEILVEGVRCHLEAARQAARLEELNPKKGLHLFRYGSLRERAMSNLDAAEAHLLNIASPEYVLGQLPSLLQHVRCHLVVTDPRRQELERIARRLGVADPDRPVVSNANEPAYTERRRIVDEERGQIVTAMRAACSASLREQVRVRSFRNVLVATALVMALLAIGVAIVGLFYPTLIPMCFAPEASGRAVVVCPTKQSVPFSTTTPAGSPTPTPTPPSSTTRDIDDAIVEAATPRDLLVVELVGLTAAAVAAAAAIRNIKGSSERYGLPVALAALKLPTGAITAVLGLVLMRAGFVPGLSALDTSAQILAWALVFGYAQQLFTRLVDRQGQVVLDSVRGANKPQATPS